MGFSQSNEEEHILKYFGDFVGTFIDVGCNDCKTFSNTHALALKGWKGIVLDPSPKAIVKCHELYKGNKGIYIYEYAISSHNGTAPLWESGSLCSTADVGLVSTFHSHEKARFDRTVKYDPVEVKTFKWKTAMNRWKIKEFDFISADCEGDEMSFLPDINLSATKLICLEHNGSEERKKEYLQCTSKYGIDKIIYESAENILIAR